MQDLSSLSWVPAEPGTPGVEAQSLNYWATRKVPVFILGLDFYFFWV